ncbi:unnamed protein product [Ectocarpus sp. 6 AP-2014]
METTRRYIRGAGTDKKRKGGRDERCKAYDEGGQAIDFVRPTSVSMRELCRTRMYLEAMWSLLFGGLARGHGRYD